MTTNKKRITLIENTHVFEPEARGLKRKGAKISYNFPPALWCPCER